MVGCDECGFDCEELAVTDTPLILDGGTALLRDQLEDTDDALVQTGWTDRRRCCSAVA
jgi:hypothetical protein